MNKYDNFTSLSDVHSMQPTMPDDLKSRLIDIISNLEKWDGWTHLGKNENVDYQYVYKEINRPSEIKYTLILISTIIYWHVHILSLTEELIRLGKWGRFKQFKKYKFIVGAQCKELCWIREELKKDIHMKNDNHKEKNNE